jgi:iron uptake system component EfeO
MEVMTQRGGALLLAVTLCGFAACDNADDDGSSADAGSEQASGGKGGSSAKGGAGGTGGSSGKGGAGGAVASEFQEQATVAVKKFVGEQLDKLVTASEDLQKAAPEPDDNGWDEADPQLEKMRTAWKAARSAYEHIEGPIAALFMELDVATDARYDAFIEENGADDNLFDDQNVTGMHAIERILYSNQTPDYVVKFEKALTGYKAAAFPKTKEEADQFKNKLCKRLVDDIKTMQEQYSSLALDVDTAFVGMITSTVEQSEKTTKAATGEDESRYAQNTMADMRANLAGARSVYEAFKPWIASTKGEVAGIEAALKKTDDAYKAVDGDALPKVPDNFNPGDPSDAHLDTPYGKLWKLLTDETDPAKEGSLVSLFTDAADKMGIEGVEAE